MGLIEVTVLICVTLILLIIFRIVDESIPSPTIKTFIFNLVFNLVRDSKNILIPFSSTSRPINPITI